MHPENVKYKLINIHLHWRGSEHSINGRKFSGELHLVFQSTSDPNKLAVLAFFFEVSFFNKHLTLFINKLELFYLKMSSQDNTHLNPIIDHLESIIHVNDTVNISYFRLSNVIPHQLSSYYRYSGSLSEPPCDEIVEWFVIEKPILTISEEQLLDLQSLKDRNGDEVAFFWFNFYQVLKSSLI
jgi:carbonic anhydrase